MPWLFFLFGLIRAVARGGRSGSDSSDEASASNDAEMHSEDHASSNHGSGTAHNGASSDDNNGDPNSHGSSSGSNTHSNEHDDDDDIEHHTPTVTPVDPDATQAEIDTYVEEVKASTEMHMHGNDASLMTEHMAAMDLVPRDEATHIAVKDGDWFDPSTWYNGEIPTDGAKVLIPEGIEVSYDGVSEVSLFTVRVDGTLDFAPDVDSQMIVDTMVISPTGHLIMGTAADPVDPAVDIDIIFSNTGPIDTDWDPMLLSRGLISHGKATIHGAEKDSHEKVIEDPMAGDTYVKFDELPEGWQTGDTIVIAGTHYEGHAWDNTIGATRLYPAEDEVRTISKIEGNTVHFDKPLVHDHDAPRADLKTSVANYTRNVSFETENAENAEVFERGHVMFMHSDNVDVRYAEFHELGRTDKSVESKDVSDFDPTEFDSNVQGRYSFHLHRTGVDDLDDPTIVVGNAVYGSPGWGFVHHDSNAVLENNASFDTFGAGYVAETGNETGLWSNNIAIQAEGTFWGIPKNTSDTDSDSFDTARGGDGFWFQGRMVGSVDNVAASVNTGFVYFHRDGDDRMIDTDVVNFIYPDALLNGREVTADDVPILNFKDNEAFAAREGLHVVKADPSQGHDIWSNLDGFTAWEVSSGAHLQYTAHYLLNDFDIVGRDDTAQAWAQNGISFGSNTSEIVISNANIDGFQTGIKLKKMFTSANETEDMHNFVVIDATIQNVDTEYGDYDPALDVITTSASLPNNAPNLELDSLQFGHEPGGWGVRVTGTKTDSLGEVDFPGATDSFKMSFDNVAHTLEHEGYWTTSNGETYILKKIYFTDRTSGDVFYETHPVFFDDQIAGLLGKDTWSLPDATYNGQQDFTTKDGLTYAGDTALGKTFSATPSSGSVVVFTETDAEKLWEILTKNQVTYDNNQSDTDHDMHDMADAA